MNGNSDNANEDTNADANEGEGEGLPLPQSSSDHPPDLKATSPEADTQEPLTFTPRERDVLTLLMQGQTNKEIAAALHVCTKTVEFHLTKIYAKLGVMNRVEAVSKAMQLGVGKD